MEESLPAGEEQKVKNMGIWIIISEKFSLQKGESLWQWQIILEKKK